MATRKTTTEPMRVDGDELVCDTSLGEVRLPLDLPFDTTMALASLQDDGVAEITAFKKAVESFPAGVRDTLGKLGTREVMRILPRWMSEFGKTLNADLGESQGSDD